MNDIYYIPGMGELPEYNTKLFREIWPDFDAFLTDYSNCPLKSSELAGTENTIYGLLFANFANDSIASMDVDQFKWKVFERIFNFGPTWKKRLDIQNKIRNMSEDELRVGGRDISNFTINPNTGPSTSSLDELTEVSQQTSRNRKRGRLDAYANLMGLLDEDVTADFVQRFRSLFRKFVSPLCTHIYPNEEED